MVMPDWYDNWRAEDLREIEEERWNREDSYEEYLAEESDLECSSLEGGE